MNKEQLLAVMPFAKSKVDAFLAPLNAAMVEFEINTPKRQAAFIAQLAHESGQFRYVEELASGKAYDGRKDLGNTKPDAIKIAADNGTTPGPFWKGHGLIQITGYDNHLSTAVALGIDCLNNPKLICLPENACRSAALFWSKNGLNELADADDFLKITKRINGGFNGLKERQAFYDIAEKVFGC